MKIEKKTLLAALRSAARMAAPRTASHWLRTCRLRALGIGDEVEFCAWGGESSMRVNMDADARPGEIVSALSTDLLPLVEAALGEHASLAIDGSMLRVSSDGRHGSCVAVEDSLAFAPPPAVAPPQLASTATLTAEVAAGFARALHLAADCVDREGTGETSRHVGVYSEIALTVLSTDGANCVYWMARVPAHGCQPIALSPAGARLLADAIMPDGEAQLRDLRLEVAEAGVRAQVGPSIVNLGRRLSAHVLSLSAVERFLRKRDDAAEVFVDPKALLSAARYAGLFSTPQTTATVLEWVAGHVPGTVRSWDGRGSTAIAMRSKKAGRACFGAERLARALSGLDGEERGAASILLDGLPNEPLQVLVKNGEFWERRHIVAPMDPEEEKR